MEKIVKQNVGIDVSKKDFSACICTQNELGAHSFVVSAEFTNNKTGLNQFIRWVRKYTVATLSLKFTMEATGIYHESLAVHLHKLNFRVSIVLPNKVKYYAKSLNVKTKTDSMDARLIARMGVEQQLDLWNPPAEVYRQLRSLTRHLQDLKIQKLSANNHLEAATHSEFSDEFVSESYQQIINMIDLQIKKCENAIRQTVNSDLDLADKARKLETINGVGFATVAVVLAETQGFDMFTSRKQLASYAGLDVVERQSGTSVKGKAKISKKGNRHLRQALYFPAIVATMKNPPLKEDYTRIIKTKPLKKIGIVAIQRKLLLLMFTLWKNNQVFNPAI